MSKITFNYFLDTRREKKINRTTAHPVAITYKINKKQRSNVIALYLNKAKANNATANCKINSSRISKPKADKIKMETAKKRVEQLIHAIPPLY